MKVVSIISIMLIALSIGTSGCFEQEHKEVAVSMAHVETLAAQERIPMFEMADITLNNGQVNIDNTLSSTGDINVQTEGNRMIGAATDAESFVKIAKYNNATCIYYKMLDLWRSGDFTGGVRKTYVAFDRDNRPIVSLQEDYLMLDKNGKPYPCYVISKNSSTVVFDVA